MECSVCMESIEYATKAPCGHCFHFECLFRWGRKHNNCPLCRGKLIEVQEEEEFGFTGRVGRQLFIDTTIEVWRRNITREVEQRYRNRPLSQYTGQQPDPVDVQLIVEQTGVSQRRAEVFLKYFEYDIVDTIFFLTESEGDLAIPEFRERDRPTLSETYVQRDIQRRILHDKTDGYEST